jgi:hypothetical protein
MRFTLGPSARELSLLGKGIKIIRSLQVAGVMNLRIATRLFGILLLGAACILSPRALRAQAPPGPLPPTQPVDSPPPPAVRQQPQKPPAQPRDSVMGAWKLNMDESDDGQKKMQDARNSSSGGYGSRRMGGGYPGGGYPGGGYPGGGGYGGRRMGQNESDEDRQRLAELLNPSRTLTLAEATKNVETDVFDDQQRKRALFTDGRKVQKSKDDNYQEITAHWDGSRLVTDEKNPGGGKMSRTFELSYDRTQLYETLHMTAGHNTPVDIRYVYDQAPGAAPAAAAATSTAQPQPKQ